MKPIWESAYGASIADVIDDVIIVTSQYSKSSHSETRTWRINCARGYYKHTLFKENMSAFGLQLPEKKHFS